MKKAAIAIPLVALLVALFLLWWHSRRPGTIDKKPATANSRPEDPNPPSAPTEKKNGPDNPSVTASTAGSLKVLVTAAASPLAGASVIVQRDGVDDLRKFETPADGSRLIQAMPPGAYVVGVRHPKYLPAEARTNVVAGQTVDLRIDLGRGGRIWGKVTDVGGNPLPKANILLTNMPSRGAVGPSMGAWSDEHGVYEMPAIPRGEWGLRILHNRFKTTERYPFTFLQGTETYVVDVSLEVGARVTGRVLNHEGLPVAGANVMIGNPGSGGIIKSDEKGEFGVYGLTNDPVNASVSAKGHATVIKRGIQPNTDGLEFRLPRPGTIVGRVEAAEIPEHFVVVLSRHEPDLNQVLRVDTRYFTNPPDGVFVVEDLSPALYWVEVQAQGYESADKPQVVVEAGKSTPELRMRFTKK